ncbi:MAG: hypothetical protein N2Z22_07855 [Turneriella sp.]|nr:hypothetical protein [Turneriella sp.]
MKLKAIWVVVCFVFVRPYLWAQPRQSSNLAKTSDTEIKCPSVVLQGFFYLNNAPAGWKSPDNNAAGGYIVPPLAKVTAKLENNTLTCHYETDNAVKLTFGATIIKEGVNQLVRCPNFSMVHFHISLRPHPDEGFSGVSQLGDFE